MSVQKWKFDQSPLKFNFVTKKAISEISSAEYTMAADDLAMPYIHGSVCLKFD